MRIGMFLLFVSIAFMGCRSGNNVVEHKQNAVALQKRIGAVVQSRVSEDEFIALLVEYNISYEIDPAKGFRSSYSDDLKLQEDERDGPTGLTRQILHFCGYDHKTLARRTGDNRLAHVARGLVRGGVGGRMRSP